MLCSGDRCWNRPLLKMLRNYEEGKDCPTRNLKIVFLTICSRANSNMFLIKLLLVSKANIYSHSIFFLLIWILVYILNIHMCPGMNIYLSQGEWFHSPLTSDWDSLAFHEFRVLCIGKITIIGHLQQFQNFI